MARTAQVERPGSCPFGEVKVSGRWCSNPKGPAMCSQGEEFSEDCPLDPVEVVPE